MTDLHMCSRDLGVWCSSCFRRIVLHECIPLLSVTLYNLQAVPISNIWVCDLPGAFGPGGPFVDRRGLVKVSGPNDALKPRVSLIHFVVYCCLDGRRVCCQDARPDRDN